MQPTNDYTGRQKLERDSDWHSVHETNLHLAIYKIRQKLTKCRGDKWTSDLVMIMTSRTRENIGLFKLLSCQFGGDFWLFFVF